MFISVGYIKKLVLLFSKDTFISSEVKDICNLTRFLFQMNAVLLKLRGN